MLKLTRNHCAELLATLNRVSLSPRQRLVGWFTRNGGHLLAVAFTLTLYFWVWGGNFNQMWMQRWFILMLGACITISLGVGKYISWLFAPATFFTLFSGLVTSFWFTRYGNAEMERIAEGISKLAEFSADDKWTMQAVMRQDASRAIFVFLALLVAQQVVTVKGASVLRITLGILGLVQSVLVLHQWDRSSFWVPYFDNPSTCGVFIAVCLWVLHGEISYYFNGYWKEGLRAASWALGLAAIISIKATTPLLALAGGMGAYFLAKFLRRPFSTKRLAWSALSLCALVLVLGGIGYLTQGKELWYDNSRFNMWKWIIAFWERQGSFAQWFGMGTGTMRTFMPIAEVEHDKSTGWYFWLHNDWLQWLPEEGWVGWSAKVLACLELFRRSLRWPSFAAALGAFGAAMLTGFPLHIPVTVLLLIVIARPFMESKRYFPFFATRIYAVMDYEAFKKKGTK